MMRNLWLAIICAVALAGCGRRQPPGAMPDAGSAFEALPDTLICVVDRTTDRGLRNLQAKRGAAGEVLLWIDGEVQTLEQAHPVGLVAGYAAREPWVTAGEEIRVQNRRYVAVPGERRVGLDKLQQAGEYRAIPVFADPADEPPADAVYLPSRPGCVFLAYVREDLMRR